LTHCVRPADTVGRFGGDEFVVVCPDVSRAGALGIARRVIETMSEPFIVNGREHFVSVSIGVAVDKVRDSTAEQLLRNADAALYRAKLNGRNRVQEFTQQLHDHLMRRLDLERELRIALRDRQLTIEYQPQVDLFTGSIVGAEALVRWHHPVEGIIRPAEFVPVAEESGLIHALGDFVCVQACRQFGEWQQVMHTAPRSITVNLSPLQLEHHGLVDIVRDALTQAGMVPRQLCVEVTETGLMTSSVNSRAALRALKELGVFIGIDDFGTGYSSMGRLKDLPVEVLKVDQSFVRGLGVDDDSAAIVASVLSLAHAMGLHAIAEGVENPHQAHALAALGCRVAQGFLFAPPLPASDFTLIDTRQLWHVDPTYAADAGWGSLRSQSAEPTRGMVGRRRLIDEFMDQIGVPMAAPREQAR
jgi:predicted signal transduction protein with EAL and GGDEF domain